MKGTMRKRSEAGGSGCRIITPISYGTGWIDHTTGKSYKLSEKDMSEMQDMLADMLKMERGQKKSETGLDHLEREDAVKAIMTHMENCLIVPKMPNLRLLRQGWCQRLGWRRWHQR